MLELTRKVGESVRIGTDAVLKVTALLPGEAAVEATIGKVTINAKLKRDFGYEFVVGTANDGQQTVKLRLLSIIRGYVRIGIDAPRCVNIQRVERE